MREPIANFRAAVLFVVAALAPTPAGAQELARLGIDSVVAVDQFVGQNASDRPNIVIDVSTAVQLANGWRAFVRPWFRQPRSPEWDTEIYQAMLQYERSGAVSTRVELGYLVSPIGLGMMDTRPGINPLIGGHAAYFSALPIFEAGAPRLMAIAPTYPLGGQVTLSTAKWDVRSALVSSAPTRAYVIGRDGQPLTAPTVEGGLGFTPRTGTRIGASVAHGDYATADELPPSVGHGYAMTMAGVEGEMAVGYTKLSGELMRTAFDTSAADAIAYSWFVQGMHTLAPRWFVAARQEGISAPPAITGPLKGRRSMMQGSEATVGYRLNTDFTLRTGLSLRKTFARSDWDQQVGMSIVWSRRWR